MLEWLSVDGSSQVRKANMQAECFSLSGAVRKNGSEMTIIVLWLPVYHQCAPERAI